MIQEIIKHTEITKDNHSLFDFNQDFSFLQELNYENNIEKRKSFRNFDSDRDVRSTKDEIQKVFNLLTLLTEKMLKVPQAVEFCIVDNKGIIDNEDQSIYVYKNNVFQKIETKNSLTRENLYIQEEMHDCDGVFFFLWNLSELPETYLASGRFYREIIMMSGLFGQIISEYAEDISWKGTVFAGVMEADWRAIVSSDYAIKKPIFAYAFQK
ncbi:hypothetical protein IGI37_000254 [Enterococcus sp. AZ194]|uniref:hypothetical protein n=1 Tax=Enterococcus sp. AZ194 TaxID=2774629 RepID=UPI003F293A7A